MRSPSHQPAYQQSGYSSEYPGGGLLPPSESTLPLPPSTSFPTSVPAHISSLLILRPMTGESSGAGALLGCILVNPPKISRSQTHSLPPLLPSLLPYTPLSLPRINPTSLAFPSFYTCFDAHACLANHYSFLYSSIHTHTHEPLAPSLFPSLPLSLTPSHPFSPPSLPFPPHYGDTRTGTQL